MFKYLRTLYTEFHPTAVELFLSDADEDNYDAVKRGMICTISNGKINLSTDSCKVMYLTLNDKIDGESKAIRCVRLSSNMVLEADLKADIDTSSIFVGSFLGLSSSSDGQAVCLDTNGDAFEVIDVSEMNTKNKVKVVVL